ncbi:hypothetical protein LB467_13495 [Salegentibacter sp. JZCK2]|uniref:hypothetical protein n=1 Tax=Salegentibacter tibetensis TaxID=2873600 RepID=UPI001CC9242E|nr:hypothetical protein [Salegentibacter tibetensis]MBZ9730704.1 hypothetical protein [Salegentibacter tibetensis]
MKKLLLLLIFTIYTISVFSQDTLIRKTGNYIDSWNERIHFFAGGGISVIANGNVYELPKVDKSNKSVFIDDASRLKPNISTGIVFTPFVSTITNYYSDVDQNGDEVTVKHFTYRPGLFSVALFVNPISFTSSDSNLSNTVDLGLGLGLRSGGFSGFLTFEFFQLKQPTDFFVDRYYGSNYDPDNPSASQYIIDGQVQSSLDYSDNSIIKNRIMSAIGLKFAYSFDIISASKTQYDEFREPKSNSVPANSKNETDTNPAPSPLEEN